MVVLSREVLEQIEHMSVSEMLWHILQYFTLCLKFVIDCPKLSTAPVSSLSMCRTSLVAVLRPMPGSFANSSTAFSNSSEEYCCSIYLP